MNEKKYNIYYSSSVNCELRDVTIELLTRCNWKCSHCYIPQHNDSGFQKETVFNILKQCRDMGVVQITFTGGEIFLHSNIIELIEEARRLYFQVILFTNVSLLDEQIIMRLSNLYLKRISCTIYSMDAQIHDSITRTKGSWIRAMQNIELISKYRIPLEIKTVLMRENALEYKELKKFCEKNDILYQATPIVSVKNNGDTAPIKERISDKDMESYIKNMEVNGSINGFDISDYACQNVRFSLDIDINGDIYPCNVYHGTIPLGNIFVSKLKDIWEESALLHKIQNLKYSDFRECNLCKYKAYCLKCPGIALLEDGDLYGKSTMACNQARVRYNVCKEKEVTRR